MGQIYKDLTIPYADFKQNYLWFSPSPPFASCAKRGFTFQPAAVGLWSLKATGWWDWSPLYLACTTKNDEAVQIQPHRVKWGWRLLKRISSSSLSCLYFFRAKTCPFCSGKILKLKVNPTLLWAGLTTMEASDQNPGGCIQLEKVVLVSPFISTLHLFFYPLCSPALRGMGGVEELPLI